MLHLSEAFDSGDYMIFLQKSEYYGVRERNSSGAKSCWSDMKRSFPQRSILWPLLYILYVNDPPYSVQHCRVTQYADDTTLSCTCGDVSNLEKRLTNDVERMAKGRLKLTN